MNFDAASSARGSGASLTFSHTVAGDHLLVFVGIDAPGDFNPTVTYDGVNVPLVQEITTFYYGAYFQLVAPNLGTHDVIVSGLPGGGEEQAHAISWTGVNQATPSDTAETDSQDSGGTPQTEVVSSAVGNFVVSFCSHNDIAAPVAGAGMTVPTSIANADMSSAVAYASGAASVNMEWSSLNARRVIYALDVNAAAAGGPTLPWQPRHTNLQGPTGATMLPGGMTPPNTVN